MKRRNFPKRVLATALIAALGLSQATAAHEPNATTAQHAKQQGDGSVRLQKTMSGHQKLPMTGNVDQDFASMMIVHHQQAVDMVDILLKDGRNEELKAMGRRMKTAQQGEIEQLARFTGKPAKGAMKPAGEGHDHADKGMADDHHGDHAKAMDAHFKALDGNGDGSISRAEFDAGHKK